MRNPMEGTKVIGFVIINWESKQIACDLYEGNRVVMPDGKLGKASDATYEKLYELYKQGTAAGDPLRTAYEYNRQHELEVPEYTADPDAAEKENAIRKREQEEERVRREQEAREEEERRKKAQEEEQARLEEERIAREQAEREEREALERELEKRREQKRLEEEKREREEEEKRARAEAEKEKKEAEARRLKEEKEAKKQEAAEAAKKKKEAKAAEKEARWQEKKRLREEKRQGKASNADMVPGGKAPLLTLKKAAFVLSAVCLVIAAAGLQNRIKGNNPTAEEPLHENVMADESQEAQEYVVIALAKDVAMSQMITEDDIKGMIVSAEQYEKYNSQTYISSSGETQFMALQLWDNREDVIGKYAAQDLKSGSLLYDTGISSQHVIADKTYVEATVNGEDGTYEVDADVLPGNTDIKIVAVITTDGAEPVQILLSEMTLQDRSLESIFNSAGQDILEQLASEVQEDGEEDRTVSEEPQEEEQEVMGEE